MTRPLTALVGSTVLVALAPAAPVPKGAEKPPVYFATKVGTEWVYKETDGDVTLRVTAVEDKDGTLCPADLAVGEAWLDGRPVFVGIVRDLSERKREQKELEDAINVSLGTWKAPAGGKAKADAAKDKIEGPRPSSGWARGSCSWRARSSIAPASTRACCRPFAT